MFTKILKVIVHHHGRVSDTAVVWFPFVFLRPKPYQPITVSRLLIMAVCFGIYAWGAALIFGQTEWGPELFLGAFALWFSVVTRPLWNLRISLGLLGQQPKLKV